MPTPRLKEPERLTEAERVVLADELMAIRCQLGEPEAFDALVERWHGALSRYVHRRIHHPEEAAETVQDVWLRILRGIPGLRHPERLRSWLFGVARGAVMDRLRKRYAGPDVAEEIPVDTLVGHSPDPLSGTAEQIRTEVEALPVLEREVMELFYLQELSLREVAAVLEVPHGTVKSRLHRARGLLRARLEEKGISS